MGGVGGGLFGGVGEAGGLQLCCSMIIHSGARIGIRIYIKKYS
jgi:hypothetical protein